MLHSCKKFSDITCDKDKNLTNPDGYVSRTTATQFSHPTFCDGDAWLMTQISCLPSLRTNVTVVKANTGNYGTPLSGSTVLNNLNLVQLHGLGAINRTLFQHPYGVQSTDGQLPLNMI